MLTEVKPLLHSKVFWISVLQLVGGFLAILLSQFPSLQDVGLYAVGAAAVQLILRVLTTTAISGIVSPSPMDSGEK